MKRIITTIVAGVLMSCLPSMAQRFSISTNLLGYACLGTLNADVSMSVSQNWSLTAGVKYNPFTFGRGNPENRMQLRQRSFSLGARMWPWHNASGWWFAGKLRYQEYNMGGMISRDTREGDRYGGGLYFGYTHMVTAHFNVEFGAGVWGGMDRYSLYSCPECGLTMDSGTSLFVLPDDILISLVYVF